VSDALNHPDERRDDLRWRAQQYLLGALDEDERRAFERALDDGRDAETAALREARELFGDLALTAPPAAPREEAKERLAARLRAEFYGERVSAAPQPWKAWAEGGEGASFRRHDEGAFEPTSSPGVTVRRLHVDRAGGRATMLVRMEPGSSYPGHRHGGFEECYVLSGDLRHGDRVMRGGDFERVDGGSCHGKQWSEEGCLLLIHSSLSDELLS